MPASPPINIALVGYEDCSAWISAGLLELFAIANVAASHLPSKRGASSRPLRCEVIARLNRSVHASQGVTLETAPLRRRYAAVIVPPLWTGSARGAELRLQSLSVLTPLLRTLANRTEVLASACSGAALLAAAGLLEGRRATTCWWMAGTFRRLYPNVELQPDRLVVRDRDRWTAAAGSAYIHLGLAIVQRFAGDRVADGTARLMLVERRRGSQSPFMRAEEHTFASDRLVQRAAAHLRDHVADGASIPQLSRRLNVSVRTLTRRFRSAMGVSPLAYVQSQRVAHARTLLETTSLPLEAIVVRCGYEDVSSFRKLFQRHVGMTPREYRSRFALP